MSDPQPPGAPPPWAPHGAQPPHPGGQPPYPAYPPQPPHSGGQPPYPAYPPQPPAPGSDDAPPPQDLQPLLGGPASGHPQPLDLPVPDLGTIGVAPGGSARRRAAFAQLPDDHVPRTHEGAVITIRDGRYARVIPADSGARGAVWFAVLAALLVLGGLIGAVWALAGVDLGGVDLASLIGDDDAGGPAGDVAPPLSPAAAPAPAAPAPAAPAQGAPALLDARGAIDGDAPAVHRFAAQVGTRVIVTVEANGTFDPTVALIAPSGAEVGRDDDSGSGLDSRLEATLPEAGEYEVRVGRFGSGAGEYVVRVVGG